MIWSRPDDEILHARRPGVNRLGWWHGIPLNLHIDLPDIRGIICYTEAQYIAEMRRVEEEQLNKSINGDWD